MKRILVALDSSETAHRAAPLGAQIAEKFGARLELVHVMPPPPVFSEPAVIVNVADLERAQYEAANALLERARRELVRPGLEVDATLLAGPAAETIADRAVASNADLVVVGSRGRAMIASALLGGVSHRLIHISKKPVLVVH